MLFCFIKNREYNFREYNNYGLGLQQRVLFAQNVQQMLLQGSTAAATAKTNSTCKSESEPDGLNLIDGTYDVKVEFKDKGGHSSSITRSYILDNTAPVLILSRPSSPVTASEEKIESYPKLFQRH